MFTVKCQEWLIDFVDISSSFIIFKFLLEVKTWLRFFNTKLAGFLWIFFQDRGFGFIECKETQEIYGHLVDGGIQRSFFKPFSKILGPKAGWVLAENSPKNSRSMAQRKTQLFFPSFLNPRKGHLFAQKRLEWTRNRYWRSSILADLFLSFAQYLCL